jgi:hypothetical protein
MLNHHQRQEGVTPKVQIRSAHKKHNNHKTN